MTRPDRTARIQRQRLRVLREKLADRTAGDLQTFLEHAGPYMGIREYMRYLARLAVEQERRFRARRGAA